ncbi:hypothetical protein A3A39_03800 [Candidatus Kaiserbacteria bacterium RIFCSPLOWO2_01_FULL_54_13]|uniref:Transcriptional repressor PaaX-like central Cas2-like domain-containing protein n=1 Tax=Candidatus Kaiserbacteria bacterium RIFCSPLOWO2_01_FULL_54_13 TaxID=1798512 RepID=A0A1F6F231_9BACT|nr:MAG: hypothetical protein A3A39_03800 [Candidatus Kaiserbacteria bacterium RIFCSPLOWO2_01_FULL_54_13]
MRKKMRERSILGPLEEDILQHLTAGDLLMSFLISGRSTRAFYREASLRAHARYRRKRSIRGLEAKGLVAYRGDTIHLTEKGRELMQILAARTTPVEAAWKGTWWIVMYDIPINLNPMRFELRRILIRAGFRKLQHSVWVHPHKCKELELFVKNHPRMAAYVRYLEAPPFAHLEKMQDWKKLATA